jgi:hypothetical protein
LDRSGKEGGCGRTGIKCFARNSRINNSVWVLHYRDGGTTFLILLHTTSITHLRTSR